MLSGLKKLKDKLTRTRDSVFNKIEKLVTGRKIDDDLIDEIEELLLRADVGLPATERIIENLREKADADKISEAEEVMILLKDEVASILENNRHNLELNGKPKPQVWIIAGVNGAGKTTTVGKLAYYFKNQGKEVMVAACDTFRAAAVEQLGIWAERTPGVQFLRAQSGADPAATAFDAASSAVSKGIDVLLIDTAGRLHTKANLMKELEKIRRVTEKVIPKEQITSRLIIDGTTGQNALQQVKVFIDSVGCDGLIVTKLDGTAKGGVMIAVAEELSVPVDFIGLGEQKEDLELFDAKGYAEALFNA